MAKVAQLYDQPDGSVNANQVVIPAAGGTLVDTTSTQSVSGVKTFTTPVLTTPTASNAVLSGTVTGTYTLGGTPTITAPSVSAPVITGAMTVADGATLTTPIISSIKDSGGTVRATYNATAKTIVDGSATSLFSVAIAANTVIGGHVDFLVRASDGTDYQAIAGRAVYSAVNKAGTTTGTITYTTAPEAKAVSSGTLTLAFTMVDSTNVATYKLQPTGSLTETTPYTIEYSIYPIRGVVTIA